MDFVLIPEERVGALIGEGGKTKRYIEKSTGTSINIENNAVTVEGEGLGALKAQNIVQAIARGFSPKNAMTLLADDTTIVVMSLSDLSEKSLLRIKGRIIGKEGKTRKIIEKDSGALVSVYGKTVALIGGYEAVDSAVHCVELLLEGAPHSGVYRFLEKTASERRRGEPPFINPPT
ncbi:KH domain protein [uncultured archaeon]|nr:KH domain protein [uncultured archaeon]